uniref:2Fe-2S iron-sulfur cluster-binding protein n=1 Tax=Massilia sp. METH4 TaxID=3123041 RepID=UPI00403EFEDE
MTGVSTPVLPTARRKETPSPAPPAVSTVATPAVTVNCTDVPVPTDPRVSLLDLLREHVHLIGTKKGCGQEACGASTVLVDGERRILSCLALMTLLGRSSSLLAALRKTWPEMD